MARDVKEGTALVDDQGVRVLVTRVYQKGTGTWYAFDDGRPDLIRSALSFRLEKKSWKPAE